MEPVEIETLKAQLGHCDLWLSRHKSAHDVVPLVQQVRDLTEWQLQALTDRPYEASRIVVPGLGTTIIRSYDYLTGALPMIPEYDASLVGSSTAVNMSGTANVYTYVVKVGELAMSTAQEYSAKYVGLYHDLENKQNRVKEVRELIARIPNLNTLERFNMASDGYLHFKAGTKARTDAANAMRNLLQGIEGVLFEGARQWPRENMVWDRMAERLTRGGSEGSECKVLKEQGHIHYSLRDALADVVKDMEGVSPANLDNLWTRVLNHIYVVLGLVKSTSG